MQKLKRGTLLWSVLALLPDLALADAERVATVRAVSPHLSDEMVRRVADLAEPVVLKDTSAQQLGVRTPREIINSLCGSVHATYVEQAAASNGLDELPLDTALGDKAASFQWPACLYVRELPEQKRPIQIKPGDTAYSLYQAYTGGRGETGAIEEFFDAPIAQLSRLQPGKTLQAPAITVPVAMTARSGTAKAFVAQLQQLDPSRNMIAPADALMGEIVLGHAEGAIASADDCAGASPPPHAQAIVHAYRFSQALAREEDINVSAGRSRITVVDNGFFGARTDVPPREAFKGSPFNRRYFKANNEYVIDGPVTAGEILQPINYAHGITPDLVSGHGTHVAGLVLGGPGFTSYLNQLTSEPWASVIILNLGRGSRTLVKGTVETLVRHLLSESQPSIVNLSISHDGRQDQTIATTYNNLFDVASRSLFVAAAGNNHGQDVRDYAIFPAALGGTGKANVITVAALDQDDHLAAFSNRSVQAVDMAAPGCRIASWIAYDQPPVNMSGTSQAAPWVTFGAGLLRSIAGNAPPSILKSRLIASGDLLPDSERGTTAFGVKLNIAKALLWFNDVLEVEQDGTVRHLLGTVQGISPLTCKSGRQQLRKDYRDMIALKRSEGVMLFYGGALSNTVHTPCEVNYPADASLAFVATHEVLADGRIDALPSVLEQNWNLNMLRDLVVRTPLKLLQ